MNVGELKRILARVDDDSEVQIIAQTYPNGTVGGTDATGIKWAGRGIDWDKNKFQICPDIKLRAEKFKEYST